MIKKYNEFINEEKLHYSHDVKYTIKSVEYKTDTTGEVVVNFPDKEVKGEFRVSPYGKITFQHWFPKSVFFELIKMVTDKCENDELLVKIKKYTKKVNESYYEMSYIKLNESETIYQKISDILTWYDSGKLKHQEAINKLMELIDEQVLH